MSSFNYAATQTSFGRSVFRVDVDAIELNKAFAILLETTDSRR